MTILIDAPAASGQPPGPSPRYQSGSLSFGPYPHAVPGARRYARSVLGSWGLDELSDDASVVVTELVENSIQATLRAGLHAPIRLTLVAGLRTVLIVVRDAVLEPPLPRPEGSGTLGAWNGDDSADPDQHGNGLILVAALSSRWDWKQCRDGGKVVRALLRGGRHA